MTRSRFAGGRLSVCLLVLALGCLRQSGPAVAPADPPSQSQAAKPAAASGVAAEPPPLEIPSGPERPDEASPRRVEHSWMSRAEWRRRHERQLKHPRRSHAELVVLGDSIVEAWCQSRAFEVAFGRYQPLNLGMGGDQTQHLLWRIGQGALDGLKPRVAVILIGVNNLGNGFSTDETVAGIHEVLERTREKLPGTPVLLLAVLPAGATADDDLRQKIMATNPRLEQFAVPGEVVVADVGAVLLEGDGSIAKQTMGDFLHPTASGYETLSAAVKPFVDDLAAR